jgi:cation transporter-like permease
MNRKSNQNSEKMKISIGSFTLGVTGALVLALIGTFYLSYLFYDKNPLISYFLLFLIAPIVLALLIYFIYAIIENEKERIRMAPFTR